MKLVLIFALTASVALAGDYSRQGLDCLSDSDCYSQWEFCARRDNEKLICVHKDSWPLKPIEWFGFFFTALWLCGSFMAGMSGGGTLVPLMRLIFGFGIADAIVLSNLSLATVAIECFFLNFKKKHPVKKDLNGNPSGLLIEYNLAILMLPMGVIGSALGALVPKFLPEPILIGVLTVCLAYVTYLTA